ncbi:hypothetical protein O4J56_14375 [Nocardiopsis sp. RSe5-2]|uniref:SH3 domain-containing protein n=1 Tax=Nocardiopsis endophytica TaxID=3018445 RepID=A0ABT4U4G8_9ACTN|nr:hypothetical protein [Nocardiopsis endophytica]MDA2811825.1 hypothetical protein [Nocardiopsis endophytica]
MSRLHAFAIGLLTVGAVFTATAPASAAEASQADDGVRTAAACSGSRIGVTYTKSTSPLRTGPAASYREILTLPADYQLGIYEVTRNSHGNVWYRVQYTTRANDWCGWVYSGNVT